MRELSEQEIVRREKLDEIDRCKIDWYMTPQEALDLGVATEII